MSIEVLKDNKSMFGINFDENKKALNSISTITSKMLKNELAGYITKFIKNELRNKTELVENDFLAPPINFIVINTLSMRLVQN